MSWDNTSEKDRSNCYHKVELFQKIFTWNYVRILVTNDSVHRILIECQDKTSESSFSVQISLSHGQCRGKLWFLVPHFLGTEVAFVRRPTSFWLVYVISISRHVQQRIQVVCIIQFHPVFLSRVFLEIQISERYREKMTATIDNFLNSFTTKL